MSTPTLWLEANQRYLVAHLDRIRSDLARFTGLSDWISEAADLQQLIQAAQVAMPAAAALDRLSHLFQLSPFEQDVLLLCAGFEMDARFLRLCAAPGDPQRAYPTFSLALAALGDAHWNALMPNAPLRHYHLIEVGHSHSLTLSPLRIDERILHYLTGGQYLDTRLSGIVQPLTTIDGLVPSQREKIEPIATVLSDALIQPLPPIVQLCGSEIQSKRSLISAVCDRLQLQPWSMSAQMVPTSPTELDQFWRLWARETLLSRSVLLLDCEDWDAEPAHLTRIMQFVEQTPSLFFISSRDRLRPPQRPAITFHLHKPTATEQQTLWHSALTTQRPDLNRKLTPQINTPQINTLVAQFNLNAATINAVCTGLNSISPEEPSEEREDALFTQIWDACRIQARPRLDDLAQPIEPRADWHDLVLPPAQTQVLYEAAAHVRQRAKVYDQWGFGEKGSRGLGISALFAGASGTGKTLAAEVLAHELKLDLYRIDLSSVVSKYIGETEKNLRQVFDAAEDGGAILLFDEADALFGKRSEVKDSRDRYANIEVSYLLQRMECYPGLAILTTNLKSAIDPAFMRRIRFVVQFPFPDAIQRAEIWRRVFPKHTPTEALVPTKLAQLNIAGGNIRNIALNAAFLAADAREPVRMEHLLQAAKTEYAKLEKSLTESEIGGWI
jgi:ATPase family associated with various cellular activities (AAA)